MPLHVYTLREHRDRRSISKYKKNNVQQSNSQHKLNRDKHKKNPLKSRARQGWLLFPDLLIIVLEVLANTIRQQRRQKFRKEEVRILLFADDNIIYVNDHKTYMGEVLQLKLHSVKWFVTKLTESNKLVAIFYSNDKSFKK